MILFQLCIDLFKYIMLIENVFFLFVLSFPCIYLAVTSYPQRLKSVNVSVCRWRMTTCWRLQIRWIRRSCWSWDVLRSGPFIVHRSSSRQTLGSRTVRRSCWFLLFSFPGDSTERWEETLWIKNPTMNC